MTWPILTVAMRDEADVVVARQRARRIAELLGFDKQDQIRIGTAVSEIARNAVNYGGGGRVEFRVEDDAAPQIFSIRISDTGPGVADLDAVMEGSYRSPSGMGLGIVGARRLMDVFDIRSSADAGTVVMLGKRFSRRQPPVTVQTIGDVAARLTRERAGDPLAEIREQNQELLRSLNEVQLRQDELAALNAELEDTNRGVVALYAELEEKAEQLKAASELKSRFLSNMSHEFRTPLNSVLALSRLLLDRVDGPLTQEQERQIGYIRKAAENLTELVNDLLDLAKVEAGKIDVRPVSFTLDELFGGLRGALKPLQTSEAVNLVFEEPSRGIPALHTDEAKVSQILRNFISNALKFTEAGEVRVSASLEGASGRIVLSVRDTGIGIAPEHQGSIFEEFVQVENRLQGRAKGTGLGLPLSRRLAELLGGEVRLESAPGQGSTFELALPMVYGSAEPLAVGPAPVRMRVLVIDDEEAFRYVLRHLVDGAGYEIVEAQDGVEGLNKAREVRPDAIILDLHMPRLDGFAVLDALAADPQTAAIAVAVSTSSLLGSDQRRRLAHARAILPKSTLSRESVATFLRDVSAAGVRHTEAGPLAAPAVTTGAF
ncbi:MAG TPA: ATP-binding protein [Microvirga sp.]|jgi:signal transduction histidine kinase|nr:ATP-binding protein [Microvirga sp.]